jgi:hypothetical protein
VSINYLRKTDTFFSSDYFTRTDTFSLPNYFESNDTLARQDYFVHYMMHCLILIIFDELIHSRSLIILNLVIH